MNTSTYAFVKADKCNGFPLNLKDILSIPNICSYVKQKGIPCIQVIFMKKTEYITFRTDANTRAILEKYATEKKWSISFVVEEIIQEWIKQHTGKDAPEE